MSVDLSWMDRIACAGMDPALFFAHTRTGKSSAAKLVCASCPVREECNAWAGDAKTGVWGRQDPHPQTRSTATSVAGPEAQAAPERRRRHRGRAERNRAGAENHPQRKGSRMSYTDEDWQRAERIAGERLAAAMNWDWSVADSAMARIVLEAARDELEDPRDSR